MAIVDYRYDPFLDVINVRAITEEEHTIPESSPYTIRLNEVPNKADPSTMSIHDESGNVFTEVSATPAQGQFWPDYSVTYGDDWNTGTIQFNAADAGKTVYVSYNGMGTLVDGRLADMMELEVTGSEQPERYARASGTSTGTYDSTVTTGSSSYNTTTYYARIYTHTGLAAGTYTLREVIQKLINLSHTQEFIREDYRSYVNNDCNNCGN